MATYYVDGDFGSDSGDGTSSNPWLTIAHLIATAGTLTAGDTVYLAGKFHEYNNSWPNNVDLTIAQWPGSTQAQIVGATNLSSTGWTNTSGTTWTKNIGAGLAVGGFVSTWHDRVDANGHYGHYKLAASAAAVVGDDFSWFYATGTGLLTIDVGTDASPNIAGDFDYMWVGKDLPVLQMTSSTRCTISGIEFGLMGGTAAGSYLLYMDGTDNKAVNCSFFDGGAHAVTMGVGTNTRNGVIGCTFSGCGSTSSLIAWYSSSGNVTGGYATDCRFIQTSYRDPSASPVNSSLTVDGVYAHTNGPDDTGWLISPGGVTLRGCTFTRPFGNPGNDFDHRNSAAVTADSQTQSDYPLYANGCTFTDTTSIGGYHVCYENCTFIATSALSGGAALARMGASTNLGVDQRLLIGNFFAWNNYAANPNDRAFMHGRNASGSDNTTIILINNTFCEVSHTDAYWPRLVTWNGAGSSGKFYARGNVIAGKQGAGTKGLTMHVGDGSIPDASFDCKGNWWFGEDSGYASTFGEGVNRNTLAEFRTNIDTLANGAVYSTNPNIDSPSTAATPTPGSNLRTTKLRQTVHTSYGVNGLGYSGFYGAWQSGGTTGIIKLIRRNNRIMELMEIE